MNFRILWLVLLLGLSTLVLGCAGQEKAIKLVAKPKPSKPQSINVAKVVEIKQLATAANRSIPTKCAEVDNINIPISGKVVSFTIEATHPSYNTARGGSIPDFTNWPTTKNKTYHFSPGTYKIYDDGETILEAVREAEWWRPNGMNVSVVDLKPIQRDIHYLRLYRRTDTGDSWPQFLVLYMDGNMRIKPHPPLEVDDTCFGSSVVIGPAVIAKRPIAEVFWVRYIPDSQTLEVLYKREGVVKIKINTVNRQMTAVKVTLNGLDQKSAFVTFRSMYVTRDNADVDSIQWKDTSGIVHDDPIMTFKGGKASEWFFHRSQYSKHNTAAPDIRIALM